ncbi:MAG: ribose-phosphate pyrophosphokinase [Candidatus Aureabacteria bacterium]|nr:ribose-phosphate pyrophosphokinase [Candidatus Auribacterota bacterium]NLW93960.1 ribose-phosphate pyrophosphokinase [Chlamydiota bacterium]HOE27763.1 ribose-phosphate pyrophosphokinase [bacterium]
MKVFCGRSNPELSREICGYLGIELGKCIIHKFKNDNTFVRIEENVRGKDVFVIQTSAPPVNDYFMELLIMIDALKHASARRVTAVLPYYPYARSDKKDQPRICITARLVADLLESAGADRVLTMNLHAEQIQGFFGIPVDQLLASPILCDYFSRNGVENCIVVAPDAGSAKRAERYARQLGLPLAILDKRRDPLNDTVEIYHIIGDVSGKNAIVFDDEIATGGSMIETAHALLSHGARDIHAGAVHAVLCGNATQKLQESPYKQIVVTNTLPIEGGKKIPKIKVLSVAQLFGEAIRRIHEAKTLSELFGKHL